MSPQGPVHAQIATELLNYLVNAAIARGLLVRLHSPFAAGPHSEPEPDFALVPAADYRSGHPTEAALIVEVADSSRRRDLVVKPAIYARANVPEYWVADLVARVVLVHRDPVGESYTSVTEHRAGEALACAALPDVAIPVERLLP